MQAMLIYNPHSGGATGLSSEALLKALQGVGYSVTYRATESKDDLDEVLVGAEGLILVAGGDGTFRAVVTRLVGKNVSVLPLPLGTANNVCEALGIRGSALELIGGLGGKKPPTRPLDLGRVKGPWGETYFVEALGFGFFAQTLAAYDPKAGKSVLRGVGAVFKTLAEHRARRYQLTLDGRDLSGAYLWVEVLNTPATGPRLKLAPDADPGDGLLDVVCIKESDRDNLLTYAKGLLAEELTELPSVTVHRGKQLTLSWDGFPVHLDAEVCRAQDEVTPDKRAVFPTKSSPDESVLYIDVMPGVLKVWLPM